MWVNFDSAYQVYAARTALYFQISEIGKQGKPMIQLVISIAIVFIIVIYPVMLAARLVGAGKTGAGSAVFAVFLQLCFGILIKLFVVNQLVAGLIAVIGGSLIYSLALDTTILRGFAISILAVAIVAAAFLLLAGSLSILGM